MTLRLGFGLVTALWALPACIVTSPPPAAPPGDAPHARADRGSTEPARPAPPADRPPRDRRDRRDRPSRPVRPAPEPDPRPAPPAPACDRDAPLLYAETTRSLDRARDVSRRFAVRATGAWSLSEGGDASSGCLDRDELEELETALAAASFDPPPPPDVTCMAMPTQRKVYEDGARDRRAAVETPCGRQAINPDVADVSRLALSLADAPSDADPPDADPPSACSEDATRLVAASARPLRNASGGATRVRVGTDGSWTRREGGDITCGQMSRRALRRLSGAVRRADIDTVEQAIRCRAVPTTEYRIATRGDRAAWQTPCGSRTPTDDARELAERILSVGS